MNGLPADREMIVHRGGKKANNCRNIHTYPAVFILLVEESISVFCLLYMFRDDKCPFISGSTQMVAFQVY